MVGGTIDSRYIKPATPSRPGLDPAIPAAAAIAGSGRGASRGPRPVHRRQHATLVQLHPAWPFAGVVVSTIVAAWLQDERAYRLYGTAKYVQFEHVLMGFAAAIAVFVLGMLTFQDFSAAIGQSYAPREFANRVIRFWFYLTTVLTIFGYAAWFAVGFKNGFTIGMFVDLLTGQGEGYLRFNSPKNCSRRSPASRPARAIWGGCAVAPRLVAVRQRRTAASVVWPLAAVFLPWRRMGCVLFSERTAMIELLLPLMLVGLRSYVLGRPLKPLYRGVLYAAPVLGCVIGLFLFFGFFRNTTGRGRSIAPNSTRIRNSRCGDCRATSRRPTTTARPWRLLTPDQRTAAVALFHAPPAVGVSRN